MTKKNENYNDKLKKWIDFEFKLDVLEMRDLDDQEEKICYKSLVNMSEKTDIALFED